MSQELEEFRNRVNRNLNEEVKWVKLWSFTHHFFLFGAIVLSAAAALFIEIEFSLFGLTSEHTGAVLAAVSALFGAIAAAGGFRRKWETNRFTRSRLHQLDIDLMDDGVDLAGARKRLSQIWADHDKGIVGGGAAEA